MTKNMHMSITVDRALHDEFMALAAMRHQPAAQIIRDLMQHYINDSKVPNQLTAETLRLSDRDEDVYSASDVGDLFHKLGF